MRASPTATATTFSQPVTRLAFQRALARANPTPGSMVYGNTVAYRGGPAANYASLAGYLQVDALAQLTQPSGHAINPVPVTENRRIPDVEEVVEAQLFAERLVEVAGAQRALYDFAEAARVAAALQASGEAFRDKVLAGLGAAGIALDDPVALLLALRRLGPRRLEALFGPGAADPDAPRGRRPIIVSEVLLELDAQAEARLAAMDPDAKDRVAAAGLTAVVATSDVHEHGKLLVERVLTGLGVALVDGGVSTDPDALARCAAETGADLIALSTYNGVALGFVRDLTAELSAQGLALALLVGGRLNQIPEDSNSSLPVEVGGDLAALGAVVCHEVEDALAPLLQLAEAKEERA